MKATAIAIVSAGAVLAVCRLGLWDAPLRVAAQVLDWGPPPGSIRRPTADEYRWARRRWASRRWEDESTFAEPGGNAGAVGSGPNEMGWAPAHLSMGCLP